MTISYSVTKDDMVAWSTYHRERSPFLRRAVRKSQVAIGVLLLLIASGWALYLQAIWFVVYALLVTTLVVLTQPRSLAKAYVASVTSAYSEGRNLTAFGPHTLTLTDDGLVSMGPYHRSDLAYEVVEQVEVTDRYTYIYIGGANAFVIPHASVVGDIDAFREELEAHLAERGQSRLEFSATGTESGHADAGT